MPAHPPSEMPPVESPCTSPPDPASQQRSGEHRGIPWTGAARLLVLTVALAALAVFAYVTLSRIGYPYELEWMEGGVLDHVTRVAEGKPLYVPPSVDFTPFIYTPLYYAVCAPLVSVLGPGFLPLRLVSLLAAVAVFWLIYGLVSREGGSRFAGLVAAGLFVATFRRGGAWFDVARVDSLFLAFLMGALYLARRHRSLAGAAAAGALLGLSFLTKQVAVSIAAPVVLWLLVMRIRSAAAFLAAASAVVVPSVMLLQSTSEGWFGYYTFELPAKHAWVDSALVSFWTADLAGAIPIAALLAVAYFLRSGPARGDRWFWLSLLAGAIGGSYLARLHSGGYDNVLLPAYAAVAVVAGLGLASLLRRDGGRSGGGMARELAILVLVAGQFALLAYDPRKQIPSAADREAGQGVVTRLRNTVGDVYVPFHGYLAALAGKPPFAHAQAVADVWKGGPGDRGRRILFPALAEELRRRRFSAVVIDEEWFSPDGLVDAYAPAERVFARPDTFRPVTGMPWRPEWIWLPKPRQ